MLDIECFTYLNALLESPMAPTVVLATNRGNALVRGTSDIVSPHGIPVDLLDRYAQLPLAAACYRVLTSRRCLIVKTEGYTREQVSKVVQLRAAVEGLKLGEGVLDKLAGEGERGSMRCVPQLIHLPFVLCTDGGTFGLVAGTRFSCSRRRRSLRRSRAAGKSSSRTLRR